MAMLLSLSPSLAMSLAVSCTHRCELRQPQLANNCILHSQCECACLCVSMLACLPVVIKIMDLVIFYKTRLRSLTKKKKKQLTRTCSIFTYSHYNFATGQKQLMSTHTHTLHSHSYKYWLNIYLRAQVLAGVLGTQVCLYALVFNERASAHWGFPLKMAWKTANELEICVNYVKYFSPN